MGNPRTWSSYIQECEQVHASKYSYTGEPDKWSSSGKMNVCCPSHGWFEQRLQDHRRGAGCPTCKAENTSKISRSNKDDFLTKAAMAHGDTYNYTYVDWKGYIPKIEIICASHGSFWQKPDDHIRGHGCPKCKADANKRRLTKPVGDFIEKAKNIHGDRYDYSLVNYVDRITKVEVICPKHGSFLTLPRDHLAKKSGCPQCAAKQYVSRVETEWLDSLGVEERQFPIKLPSRTYIVDGYDPSTNTVYLFHGDYWHGNPNVFKMTENNKILKKSFQELYDKTKRYENEIIQAGYNLIVMWESDWRTT